MPPVEIDLLAGRADVVGTIGDCVHEAMVGTLGVPSRDHFQIQREHEPGALIFDPGDLELDPSDWR